MPRMQILSTSAFQDFHQPPKLTASQRKSYFDFSTNILLETKKLRTKCSQIGFLLSLGYFKISKRFFNPQDFCSLDITHIAQCLDYEAQDFQFINYALRTRQKHQIKIANIFNFKKFECVYEKKIKTEITTMVQHYLKPKLIFWRCIDLMIINKIIFPSYYRIQNLILVNIAEHKTTMNNLVKKHLTPKCRAALNSLLEKKLDFQQFQLTLLKKHSQSIAPKKINIKLQDLTLFNELYEHILPILQNINLTSEGIRYFSASIIKTKTTHFLRREKTDIDLHIISFIAHQYYCLQDNLVDVFLSAIKNNENAAKRHHKDWYYQQRRITNTLLTKQIECLETQVSKAFAEIHNLIKNPILLDFQKLQGIEKIVSSPKRTQLLSSDFDQIKTAASQKLEEDDSYFDILENRSIYLQNRVSGILKKLSFQSEANIGDLKIAVDNFIIKDGYITKGAPVKFLSDYEVKMVMKGSKLRPSLYKVFLFQYVAKALKSGCMNLIHSYKYLPLECYLIDKKTWNFEKESFLQRANMQEFAESKYVLKDLSEQLLAQFNLTNGNIYSNLNQYIKLKRTDDFVVSTPKQDDIFIDSLTPFLPQRHFVPLSEILATVNKKANFTNELQHWQQQYNRDKPLNFLYASVMGLGMAIGTRKMARISRHIGEDELENTVNGYLSLNNVRAANDCIVKSMSELELPKIYQRSLDKLHTASDGQKFEVTTESLNSNYSFKYFGQGQGVSAYTFIDERNFLWHSLVFSAAERESAYVIDGLMMNDVVKSDIHSTDTHGYSEVMFAVTHLLGFSFAPRIKNLKKQRLYIFKSDNLVNQNNWFIKPVRNIDINLIQNHWDDILRFITTIKIKKTTASTLFKRLNSYSKQHALYAALKAYGRVIKSIFILRYIDDVTLRQAIEKQLNKVELANRFTRAVAVGNPKEMMMGEKEHQEIAESCNRLIKNSIIFWNYLYLELRLKKSNIIDQEKIRTVIKAHSPISWAHINFLGEYDFSDEKVKDSWGILPTKK